MDTTALKAALAGYKRKLAEITPETAAGNGLAPEVRKALTDALGTIRKEAATLNAKMVEVREQAAAAAQQKGRVEEDKLLGVLAALEEEEGQLKRCYAIPRVITGGAVVYNEAQGSPDEPPRKRLLKCLRDGVRRKHELTTTLSELTAAHVDPMPLISIETRGRVRELNAVSTNLIELDGMKYKPAQSQFKQGPSSDDLPAGLRLAWTNIKSLMLALDVAVSKEDSGSGDTPATCLTDLSFDANAKEVGFKVNGVGFKLAMHPAAAAAEEREGSAPMEDVDAGSPPARGAANGVCSASPSPVPAAAAAPADVMCVSTDFPICHGGTTAFAHLLPGVQNKAVDGGVHGDGGWWRFAWLDILASTPKWAHSDFADMNTDVVPGHPLIRCGQLRAYASIDGVINLLAERIQTLTSMPSSREAAAGQVAQVIAERDVPNARLVLAAADAALPSHNLIVAYSVDTPYRPVNVCVVGKDITSLDNVQMKTTAFDPLFCAVDPASVAGSVGDAKAAKAAAAAVNYDLGLSTGKQVARTNPPPALDAIVAKAASALAASSQPKRSNGHMVTTCWTAYGALQRKWQEAKGGWVLVFRE